MEILKPNLIFLSIMLIIGTLTVITDLQNKKIYNDHLAIAAVLGLAAIIYTAVWRHENILFHISNGLIAFVIGVCFHRFDLWRGGDAKLFTLYAFLMPALKPDHILLSSAINLFACSFIAGMIVLTPIFIKDIASNYNAIINKLSPKTRKELLTEVKMTIFLAWILFPVYYFARTIQIPFLSLVITYLIFYIVHHFLRKTIKINFLIAASGITFGFLMHLWLSPNSLSWPVLPYFILKIGLYYALFACIYTSFELLEEYKNRVPFAPLLFIGCVLSYTPFLTWIMHMMNLIRR